MSSISFELIRPYLESPSFWIMVFLALCCSVFYNKIAGLMGEFWVKFELNKLSKKDYKIINDVMIEDDDGTHQIDHLVISRYGIFVIETKNYSGKIYGKDFSDQWVQYLGHKKYYFHSPVKQNYGHILTLQKVLRVDKDKFISLICFSNRASLKAKSKVSVVNLDFILKEIKKYDKVYFTYNEMNDLYDFINKLNITDKKLRRKHVKKIKNKYH